MPCSNTQTLKFKTKKWFVFFTAALTHQQTKKWSEIWQSEDINVPFEPVELLDFCCNNLQQWKAQHRLTFGLTLLHVVERHNNWFFCYHYSSEGFYNCVSTIICLVLPNWSCWFRELACLLFEWLETNSRIIKAERRECCVQWTVH